MVLVMVCVGCLAVKMPISHQDLPYVSSRVIFDATKDVSAYRKKVAPHTYRSCEPGNPKSQLIQQYSGKAEKWVPIL